MASPFHVHMFVLMFIRCCAPGFRSVKQILAPPAFCMVFAAFSYYPTTCGLEVSSPSSLKTKVRSLRAPKQQFKLQQHTFRPHFHQTKTKCGRGVVQNASKNHTFGDRSWSPKNAFSNTTMQSIQVRNPAVGPAFSTLATSNMYSYCS